MVTIGSILEATFRFARANVRVIAIWSAVNLVVAIAMRILLQPVYQAQLAAIDAAAQGVASTPPPMGMSFLIFVPMTLIFIVLYNAVFRAVLFPQESKAAYLRVGMDELRVLGLLVAMGVVATVAIVLFGILIGLVVGALAVVVSGAATLLAFLTAAGLWLFAIFVTVRLSLAAPLTVYRRQIVIGPAWRLTRGRFWTLFVAYLLLALGVGVIFLIYMFATMAPMLSAMAHPGDIEAARQLAAMQAEQMRLTLSPLGIIELLVGAAIGGIMLAIFAGLPAIATAQLLDEQAGLQ